VCIAYEIDGKRCNDFPTNAKPLLGAFRFIRRFPVGILRPRFVEALTDLPKQALVILSSWPDGWRKFRSPIVSLRASRDQTIIVEDQFMDQSGRCWQKAADSSNRFKNINSYGLELGLTAV
jgi:adenylosuccinate synthase